ncbi:MAG: nucleotidyltransferase, partial [Zoogloea sp.]|nr:nucleotidyltransferase [Zoogloea sp.]
LEQTLATDQDNGLIFEARDAGEAAALRTAFLPFAQEVNRLLDACGFPLCRGGVMAGNAACCLSLAEWQSCFRTWIGHADPTALLNASIYFDLRPLYGERSLADELQAGLLAHVAEFPLFLHLMAANALACQPPLGRIRDFVLDRRTGRIDLKRDGSRLFVDAARLFALACGRPETGTEARLRAVGGMLGWREPEIDASVAAFHAILSLRLRQQLAARPGEDNLIAPDMLNVLDRVLLKESLRQARLLQDRLRLSYPS